MDPIYEAYSKSLQEPTFEEFVLHMSEYVGSNEPVNTKRFAKFIKEYTKRYSRTYRMWSDKSWMHKDKIKFAPVQKGYLATCGHLDDVENLCIQHEGDFGAHDPSWNYYPITQHSGPGIYMVPFLEKALKSGDLKLQPEEIRFIKDIIRSYEEQDEVLIFTSKAPTMKDVIGYYDPEDQEIVIL